METCSWWLPLEYKDNLAWKVGITKKIRLLYVLTLNICEVCSGALATFKSIFFITEWKETCCNHKQWIIIKWYVLGISLLVRKLKKNSRLTERKGKEHVLLPFKYSSRFAVCQVPSISLFAYCKLLWLILRLLARLF